eukprot:SAG11_NODE_32580_length_282_cov_1.125683_1_plen_60_part_00
MQLGCGVRHDLAAALQRYERAVDIDLDHQFAKAAARLGRLRECQPLAAENQQVATGDES